MNLTRTNNFLAPACMMPNGVLVCYKHGDIVLIKDNEYVARFSIISSIKENFFGKSKIISRFFRLGIRTAETIDEDNIVFCVGNYLYELNISTKFLSNGFFCGEGIRPLSFTTVSNVGDFDDGIYFGGYLNNMDKNPVCIYHRTGIDQWVKVYSFPNGSINHVHNIVPDSYRNCLWIFTGDFGEASAIWKVTDNFKKVERVVCNDQKFRGCVAYALPDGLLYATDAPFADDYIYIMNTDTYEVKEVLPIAGSCIYGCRWKDKYVFSTTVEGDGRDMSRIEWLFTRKRGAGIKDDYVHMYIGNMNEGFKEIYKEIKDFLPYYTLQFGAFKFPSGINNSDYLYFQPIATKKNDLCLMTYSE